MSPGKISNFLVMWIKIDVFIREFIKQIEISVNIPNFTKWIEIIVSFPNFTKWIKINIFILILRIKISLVIRNTVVFTGLTCTLQGSVQFRRLFSVTFSQQGSHLRSARCTRA